MAGSRGMVTVTGAGSSWTAFEIIIGAHGEGTLSVLDGASVDGYGRIAGFAGSKGTVTVSGLGSTWTNGGYLFVGDAGEGALSVADGGKVITQGVGQIGGFDGSGTVSVEGPGSSWSLDGALRIGAGTGQGVLTITNGGVVQSGHGLISDDAGSVGVVSVTGTGSIWVSDTGIETGFGNATLTVTDGGTVGTGPGGRIALGSKFGNPAANPASVINIGAETGNAAAAAGILATGSVDLGGADTRLVFNHTGNPDGSDYAFAPVITNSGTVNHLAGTTILTGSNSAGSDFTGTLNLSGGTLTVGGIFGDTMNRSTAINVTGSGKLAGNGTIAGSVDVGIGGTLLGSSDRILTVAGNLALTSGSALTVSLSAPSSNALFSVGGNLTLGGTLNVADAGGFGAGVYRLIDYYGAFTDNGMTIGTTPQGVAASDLLVQTAVAGQVNLVSHAGVALGFWDGDDANLHVNGRIDGGSGTWRLGGDSWTDHTGTFNGSFRPNPTFAVFQGAGGTVTVNGSAGAIGVTGMQFATSGYRIAGDTIALEGAGGQTIIRVGDGTQAGAAMTATIASALTGTSSLVKDDLGTLILTGANSYTGDTLVRSGMLVASVAAIRGNVGTAGTIVFDQAVDATFAGDITGLRGTNGTMVKEGAGALVLGGTSSLDWTVNRGSLTSATNRFTGNLALASGATFTFDQSYAGVYAGRLSGLGTISYTGGGKIELTGDSSGYRGMTQVRGTTLAVNDKLGGSAVIGSGGRLQGTGAIGSGTGSTVTVAFDGTLAPGNSRGTLTIDGNLVLDHGARYEVEVVPGTALSDLVKVTGSATLNGGTVAHVGMTGAYTLTSTYTILTASGGVTGAFDGVTSNFAFLDPALGYTQNAVTLSLKRNGIGFVEAGTTRNQRATAEALDTLGFGNPLYDKVVQLDTPTARTAFDQLSGEIHASAIAGLIEESRFVRNAATDRIRAAFGDVGASIAPTVAYGAHGAAPASAASDSGLALWSNAYGAWGKTRGDSNAALLERSTGGFLLGADAGIFDTWRLGILGGYSHGSVRADSRASSASIDSYHLGLYSGTRWDSLSLRTGVAYSWNDIHTSRSVGFTGFSDRVSAAYRAATLQAFGEVGYSLDTAHVRLEPFINFSHVSIRSGAFTESGAAAALTGRDNTTDMTFSTLGLRGEKAFDFDGMQARLTGTIGWRHVFGETIPTFSQSFAGSASFRVAGAPIAKDALVLEAGLGLDLSPNATLGLSYQGQIANHAYDLGLKATLDVRF
ncbi:autotransporter domain-containing protein [Neorhizobium galegae]|uniref:autotransporter domain-containing protein n=1 Tax=Neorhizobium galegae TaxID=399 RepID=UPI0021026C72|nr:autotransporter domain-containing protein [Neorhizobium galegae]MCQ1781372.1 autotransporter domain-containing protein [Neorhizobium galegae]